MLHVWVSLMLLVLLLASGATLAGEPSVPVRVFGAGIASCGRWLEARRTQDGMKSQMDATAEYEMGDWIAGYIRGFFDSRIVWAGNVKDPLATLDPEAIYSWIDQYGDAHRLDMVLSAGDDSPS